MSSKVSSLSALPSMPDLDVGEDEDIEMADDNQDENHLLSILQKLKTAKRTLDSSRQKKKARQLLEQSSARFNTDADEVVSKHNKRWTNKINALQQKIKKLKMSVEDKLKTWGEANADFEQRLKEHRIGIQNVLHSLQELEKESKASKEARDVATAAEISRIRTQVTDKLKQVQSLLIKTHSRSVKDDKFTMLIKSFITSL
eukprot:gene25887-29242_t